MVKHRPDTWESQLAPDWMIVSATRYALGRRSYIVGMTVDYLLGTWKKLSEKTKHVIRRDIKEYLDGIKGERDFTDNDWEKILETDSGKRIWVNTFTYKETE